MARGNRLFRIVSWNVNGIRAALKKGLLAWIEKESPDILCFQETKAFPSQLPPELLLPTGYHAVWNAAERPGYSGVSVWSRLKPVKVKTGFGIPRFDAEGRVLETDHGAFTLLNIYFPNGKMNEERLRYKMDFYEASLRHFKKLVKEGKRLVICGDYNTAHKPLDLKNPKDNESVSGFLPEERAWMDRLVAAGFIDAFRVFNTSPDQYTWWDLRTGARERNVGWRIDYHFISENLRPNLEDATLHPEVMGSDHCPIGLTLRFNNS